VIVYVLTSSCFSIDRFDAEAEAVAERLKHDLEAGLHVIYSLCRVRPGWTHRRTVDRIWSDNDIKLDPNPSDRAMVLCYDEKSQFQALETHPTGAQAPEHDYVRHGTITMFVALEQMTGKLITRTEARHTPVEWLRFLKQFDRETPRGLDLHLIGQLDLGQRTHPQRQDLSGTEQRQPEALCPARRGCADSRQNQPHLRSTGLGRGRLSSCTV